MKSIFLFIYVLDQIKICYNEIDRYLK